MQFSENLFNSEIVVFLIIFWPKSSKHDKTKRSDSNLRKTGWSERCLHSLNPKRQSIEEEFEVLVTDDLVEWRVRVSLKTDSSCILGSGKKWTGGQSYAGVAWAKGEWIVFLDDDCFAMPEYLEAYSNAISQYPETQVFEDLRG